MDGLCCKLVKMKTVYFVRHGESEANINVDTSNGVFQGNASPLTERGREQARFIASRCDKLPIDVIVSSNAVRAYDTAIEIQSVTGKAVEINELFVERQPPPSLIGKLRSDPDAKELLAEWHKAFYEPQDDLKGGENYNDLKKRVCTALQMLAERPEKHILVATHGFFLHMLIAVVLLGEELRQDEFAKIARKVWMNNTGTTQIDLFQTEDKKFLDGTPYLGWVLRVWNDHAHLG